MRKGSAKGGRTFQLLELIGNTFVGVADLADAFLKAGHGASMGRIEYEFRGIQSRRAREEVLWRARRSYDVLISRLKRDGIIEEVPKGEQKGIFFKLTGRGKEKLASFKANRAVALPGKNYVSESKETLIIVVFDIPERDRRKRDWIRAVLRNLDLQMIQKSVWFGKRKLPREFLTDLASMKLIDFVEIFEISKKGSLRSVI